MVRAVYCRVQGQNKDHTETERAKTTLCRTMAATLILSELYPS